MAITEYDQSAQPSLRSITPLITDAGGLNVDVAGFSAILNGTLVTYNGSASVAMTGSSVNYLYVDSGGVLNVNTSGYPDQSSAIWVGRVATAAGSIGIIYADRVVEGVTLPSQLILASNTSIPSAPPASSLSLYARSRAGRQYLDVQGPSGRDYPLQPFLGTNKVIMWLPENTTTIRTWGMPITNVGTVSHPTLASTNLSTSVRRWRLTSATTANSAAENRCAQLLMWRGNASGLGGFTFVAFISLSTLPANHRSFFGLLSATGATSTTQSPSALTNCLGFAYNSAETHFYFQHNDGAGAATRIDLGANFPSDSTTACFTFFISCAPNSSGVHYRAVREDTGDIVDGTVSTDLPASTQFLTPHLYMNNGGTAAACSFDCGGLYLESDR